MGSVGVVALLSGSRWEETRRGRLTATTDRERLSLGPEPDRATGCVSRSPLRARSSENANGQETSGDPRRASRRLPPWMGGP
jgi:hypothetical protein